MYKDHYIDEFRRGTVALYRDDADATVVVIAADLGISHSSLTACLNMGGVPIRKP
ncbi:hypothetical protein [Nocardia sp. AG03]|uniref:hypothetical protein n=1 Tax=Nocardia sp. AG03 TaxID=3025312 RepID=UPI002418A915|nr:hypothetical protein [Nocardia sp. AG03]